MLFLDSQKIYLKPYLIHPYREEKAKEMPVSLPVYFYIGYFEDKYNKFEKIIPN